MYAGEVALGVVLADPSGEITALQQAARCPGKNAHPMRKRTLLRSPWSCRNRERFEGVT